MTNRRYASVGLMRRDSVRGTEGRIVQTYQSILGPLLYLQFDSALGIARTEVSPGSWETDSWTDQSLGAAVPAPSVPSRPLWHESSASFGGAPSVESTLARYLSSQVDNPLINLASGSRPYIFSVFRRTSIIPSGSNQGFFCLNASDLVPRFELRDMSAACTTLSAKVNNATESAASFADTLPHKVEAWLDGANLNIRVDGAAPVAAASSASTGASIRRVSIGALNTGYGRTANAEYVLHLVCTSKPTEEQCTALRALAAQRYGF